MTQPFHDSDTLLETFTQIAVQVSRIQASQPTDWLNEAAATIRKTIAPKEVVACVDSHQSIEDDGWGGLRMGLSAANAGCQDRWVSNYIDSLIEARVPPDRLWQPESSMAHGAFVPSPQVRALLKTVIDVFSRRLGSVDMQYAGCAIETLTTPGPRIFWSVVWYYQPIPEPIDQRQQLLARISRVTASAYTSALNTGMERRGLLLERLTPGQRRVARLMALGYSKRKIAAELDRSEHTVHDHIKSIYNRLCVRSRAEFMALWADA